MYAEHIVGLTAVEHAAMLYPERLAEAENSLRLRFGAIKRDGYLVARGRPKVPSLTEHGSTFDFDLLVGDGQYVFLSHGPRYRLSRTPELCYGFVFDAQQLIDECGALVGPDLLEEYEDLADKIVREVEATLPPLPMTSDEEIADFGRLFDEDDPELLAYVQQQSTSRYWDIFDGMRDQDESVPGVAEALKLFRERVGALQARLRSRCLVGEELEVLVPGRLPLSLAVGTIERGEIIV